MTIISYEPFEVLIGSLRGDGLHQHADVLDHLLHKVAWTTGSEMIGELGQRVKKIQKEDFSRLSAETNSHLIQAINMVKTVWPDFPEE
jgi:hypothetical protein